MSKVSQKTIALIILVFCSGLNGCASTSQFVEYAKVTRQMKVAEPTRVPGKSADTGLKTGVLTGGGLGATAGYITGVAFTIGTFGLGAPAIPAFTFAGAAIGAGSGGAVGASAGYVYGIKQQGNGLFAYVVTPENANQLNENLLIHQYEKVPIPIGTRVKVMKQNNLLHIEIA